ncbi:MAG: hypothetical protein IJ111_06420 [Eggerthellaceae bacterium]|nr:hypothetical protein [Eggerthellaceae bacterium]
MELDCGIQRKRIVGWLRDELALSCEGQAWVFEADGKACHITADELESRRLGTVNLDRTLVTIEGDEAAAEAFMRLFTLRFMSAGG